MSTFTNKHVLITGGASGIGFLMAKQMMQEHPASLTLWDINKQELKKACKSLSSKEVYIHSNIVDIAQPEEVYPAAEQVLNEVGPVDILVNNAGIVVGKRFSEHSPHEIEKTIRVNLTGAMHVTAAFLPAMSDNNNGHIVNIASAAGLIPNPKMSVYAGSKWGMIGWSESLRTELKQEPCDIKVTTIEPSYIKTGMFEGVAAPRLTPLLEPEDIAAQIIYAVKHNKIQLRAPFMVKLIPFLKGVLPRPIFDFVAGKLFMVYRSMDTFKGKVTH